MVDDPVQERSEEEDKTRSWRQVGQLVERWTGEFSRARVMDSDSYDMETRRSWAWQSFLCPFGPCHTALTGMQQPSCDRAGAGKVQMGWPKTGTGTGQLWLAPNSNQECAIADADTMMVPGLDDDAKIGCWDAGMLGCRECKCEMD